MIILIDSGNSRLKVGWLDPSSPDMPREPAAVAFDGLDRSIDARISRLRRKLGDNPEQPERIKTVRGRGYLFSRSAWG